MCLLFMASTSFRQKKKVGRRPEPCDPNASLGEGPRKTLNVSRVFTYISRGSPRKKVGEGGRILQTSSPCVREGRERPGSPRLGTAGPMLWTAGLGRRKLQLLCQTRRGNPCGCPAGRKGQAQGLPLQVPVGRGAGGESTFYKIVGNSRSPRRRDEVASAARPAIRSGPA